MAARPVVAPGASRLLQAFDSYSLNNKKEPPKKRDNKMANQNKGRHKYVQTSGKNVADRAGIQTNAVEKAGN